MDKLEIKYRNWHKGSQPKPIKLQIPGWAGEINDHKDGDKPQPWHCTPFVEGACYGLELYYPFNTECHIKIVDGKLKFEGDFSKEQLECPEVPLPPFLSFAPGHFGMTSALDIQVPPGYILRTEPHPRFYTDQTYNVPCCITGHLQTEWWSKIFFVVFKNPMPGQTLIFKPGEPYGQVLVLPKKINYDIREMTSAEAQERAVIDNKINKCAKKFIKNEWKDNLGNKFDDKYKILSTIFNKKGNKGIKEFLDSISNKLDDKIKFHGKLIKVKKKNENI